MSVKTGLVRGYLKNAVRSADAIRHNLQVARHKKQADQSLLASVNEIAEMSLKSSLKLAVRRRAAADHFPRQMAARFWRNASIPSAASSKSRLHAITSPAM